MVVKWWLFETAASPPPQGEAACLSQRAHDVGLLHDQEFLAVELDLGARPFAEQHAVAYPEVDRDQLAGLVAAARADGGDFALRGLFLGGIRNDDAALGFFFGVDTLDHDAVVQGTEFGFSHDVSSWRLRFSGLVHRTCVECGPVPKLRVGRTASNTFSNRGI